MEVKQSGFSGENCQTYSFWAWEFAGDVEVDEVLTNNDIRYTVTIISNLWTQRNRVVIKNQDIIHEGHDLMISQFSLFIF